SGQQNKEVHEQEHEQVPPAKAPGCKLFLCNQRPAELKPTLDQVQDAQAKHDLAERADPGNLLKPTVEINEEWNYRQSSYGIGEREGEKQALGDHGSEPHQEVNHERHEHGQQAHYPADRCEEVNPKEKD